MKGISHLFSALRNRLNLYVKEHRVNARYRKHNSVDNITLLANNCNGAFMLHDLGLRFNSPFVNLWMDTSYYLKFLQNIKYYLSLKLEFVKVEGKDYPVGKLDDILIYFLHYHSNEEVERKWEERKRRMDFNRLFVLMTEIGDCTYEDLLLFDSLPFEHKVVLTHKPYPEIASSFYIKGFENEKGCGILSLWDNERGVGKRYYDQFDFVSWFNEIR